MCRGCHGAPGIDPSVIGEGLNPPPPELATAEVDWSDAELFWIVKNGIRLSGMPAFGISHDDRELWNLVAFVRRISRVSAEEYERLAESSAPAGARILTSHPTARATR
jgi:mono/diheme cytochrome c family protein